MDDLAAFAHLIGASALSAPLLYAGTSKLLDPSRFMATVETFGVGLLRPTPASALAVATVELFAGGSLIVSDHPAAAAVGGAAYTTFTALMARAWRNGSAGDCGCFGALGGQINGLAVLRNAAFACGAFGLAYARATHLAAGYDAAPALIVCLAVALGGAALESIVVARRI